MIQRPIAVGGSYMFFFAGAFFCILYYLPIYFQSVHDTSAVMSGVRMLAFIIPLTLSTVAQGMTLGKVGIAPLFWISGATLATVGCGLFYTMDTETSTGKWIGYQILAGFGVGWAFQVALSNAQIHAAPEDISQVSAILPCKLSLLQLF
jgi:MFS transporter, DHA2 family, glioxin efflux transporter